MPTAELVLPRRGFAALSPWAAATSAAFVSRVAIDDGLADRLPSVRRPLVAIQDVRGRGTTDLPENTAMPRIQVDADTYAVRIDGELMEHDPATELPMAQRYFLF